MKTNTNRTLHSLRSSRSGWKNHLAGWKTYALAGGASLAAGTSADAQIVHTVVNQTISGNGSLKLSIDGHAVTANVHATYVMPVPISVGAAGLVGPGVGFAQSKGFAWNYHAGSAIGGAAKSPNSNVAIRTFSQSRWGHFNTRGNFGSAFGTVRAGAVQGFIGFQTTGVNHDKGWIQVQVGPAQTPGLSLTIIDYAYNSSGGPINAGDTGSVPEPGTMALALMAAGAAGLASIRKARAKFANQNLVAAEAGATTEAVA
jgi:hypothetical protein